METEGKKISLPAMDLENGTYGCCPYHLSWGSLLVEISNAQLLCTLGERLVFFADDVSKVRHQIRGDESKIITLSREQAEHAWKINGKLYLAEGCICRAGDKYDLLYTVRMDRSAVCRRKKKYRIDVKKNIREQKSAG